MCGAESWKTDKQNIDKVQEFINKSLRTLLRTYWPEKIMNSKLSKITKQEPVSNTIKRREWKWIAHTLRKDKNSISISWAKQSKVDSETPGKEV